MRPIESYLVYLTLYALWFGSALPFTDTAAWALLFTFIAHLAVEKPRWQLALLYLQITQLLYTSLLSSSAVWPASWSFIVLSSVLVMLSSALACLLPLARFPDLGGKFQAVGVVKRWMPTNFGVVATATAVPAPSIDGAHHRHHHHGKKRTAQRYAHLGLTIWYPSSVEPSSKPAAQFMNAAQLAPLAKNLGMPSWILSHLSLARTRAVPDLPLVSAAAAAAASAPVVGTAGSKLPVVIFSHGLTGVADMYAMQACELASQGYVVFAPTHNDGSAILAQLPNNKSLPLISTVDAYRSTGPHDESDDPHIPSLLAMRSLQLATRVAEVEFIVDAIVAAEKHREWPVPVPFAGRLDTERIALVGHSFGGATVVTAAARDARIKAVVSHDVWTEPMARDLFSSGLPRTPALHTISQKWDEWLEVRRDVVALTKSSGGLARLITFPGTLHSNYSDVPLFSQLLSRRMAAIGPLDMKEGMSRINAAQVEYLESIMAPAGASHAERAEEGARAAPKQAHVNGHAASPPPRMFDALIQKQAIKIIDASKDE